jgi:arsenite-transporting ATPase
MVGIDRLTELGESLFGPLQGGVDPGDIFFVGQTQQIIEEGQDFILKLPLPNVEVEKVRLKKRGDELFVSIGNFKRELLLPTVLAQRSASSANFQNGMLIIRFPPAGVAEPA